MPPTSWSPLPALMLRQLSPESSPVHDKRYPSEDLHICAVPSGLLLAEPPSATPFSQSTANPSEPEESIILLLLALFPESSATPSARSSRKTGPGSRYHPRISFNRLYIVWSMRKIFPMVLPKGVFSCRFTKKLVKPLFTYGS